MVYKTLNPKPFCDKTENEGFFNQLLLQYNDGKCKKCIKLINLLKTTSEILWSKPIVRNSSHSQSLPISILSYMYAINNSNKLSI